jgi:hypothetical protein
VPVVSKAPRGSSQPLWLVRAFRSDRQPGLERANSGTIGMVPSSACALIPDLDRPRYFEA